MNLDKDFQKIILAFNCIIYKIESFNRICSLNFSETMSTLRIVLTTLKEIFLQLLQVFQLLLTLRIIITWFPNLNPRKKPFIFVIQFTRKYLEFFANICPKFFNMDLSSILAFTLVQCLIQSIN
jgi:YggT family protein